MAVRNTLLGGTDFIDASSTLSAGINDTDTTIPLTDATDFPSSGTIIIGSEIISYTGKSTNDLTGATRGIANTTAQSHTSSTSVVATEVLGSTDVNDTFNSLYQFAVTNSIWWMSPEMYDVVDDVTKQVKVRIHATSLTIGDFAINDCSASLISAGLWEITCSVGYGEIQRSKIYKTLFYGTDGSNARIKTDYVTGITQLQTNVLQDVGKKATYVRMQTQGTLPSEGGQLGASLDGTFASTTGNENISSWARGESFTSSGAGFSNTTWAVPIGAPNMISLALTTNSDQIGIDKSDFEVDNAETCRVTATMRRISGSNHATARARVFFLSSQKVTFVENINPGLAPGNYDYEIIYFDEDHSVPAMTLLGDGENVTIGGVNLIFSASTNAGGTTPEARARPLTVKRWDSNHHLFFRVYMDAVTVPTLDFSGTNVSIGGTSTTSTLVLVIAKGANVYDLYVGGKRVITNKTAVKPIIELRGTGGNYFVDDVRQTKFEVQ